MTIAAGHGNVSGVTRRRFATSGSWFWSSGISTCSTGGLGLSSARKSGSSSPFAPERDRVARGPTVLAQLGDRLGSGQDPAEFRIEFRRRDPSKLVGCDRASLVVVEIESVRRVDCEAHLEAKVGA